MNKLISAGQAAKLIIDGDIVTVSSSSGLACPDAVLAAIGERYQQASHPNIDLDSKTHLTRDVANLPIQNPELR